MLGSKNSNLLFLLVWLLLLPCSSLLAQEEVLSDTIFIEISLTDDYVIAIDTFGNDWYYNFETDQFVLGSQEQTRSSSADALASLEIPIEERCIVRKKVKQFSNSVTIGIDEYVDGDIISTGRVNVKGWVKGSVTSLNKRVKVYGTGQVDGDVNAPTIIVSDGGVVLGELDDTQLNLPDLPTEFSEAGIIAIIIVMGFLFICIFLLVALMPKKIQAFSECYNSYKVRTSLLGFLLLLIMPLLIALVAITIVGIVFTPLVPFLYFVAAVMGLAAFSNSFGRFVALRIFGSEKSVYFQTFIGFSVYAIFWIMGITLMSGNEQSPLFGFGVFFLVISILLSIVPFFGGIGAALLTRFGFRPYMSWKDKQGLEPTSSAPAPAPPPIPNAPIIKPPPSPNSE